MLSHNSQLLNSHWLVSENKHLLLFIESLKWKEKPNLFLKKMFHPYCA